jgi:Ran GTPase-activating protein (RanGAP) involved in mRNA processing and transport
MFKSEILRYSKFLHSLINLVECKDTLKSVDINDNMSINKSIPQLTKLIKECKNLEYLNISDLNMKKKNCVEISKVLIE